MKNFVSLCIGGAIGTWLGILLGRASWYLLTGEIR